MAPKPSKAPLPPKEQNLFKSVVRLYETKQLKKALKSADTILKRFPDHGETLAMKGLTLNALEKKAEATELVRRGLRMDMKSHICWHVYGLLYRSERDYREAAKAYLNALRIDKDNQQILRDLALLQIQIRDYDGLEDTRRRLLTVRPNQRNNWIGFALSYHLLGNYVTAVSVLDTYHDTLKQSNEPADRYETSELLLYKNLILEESGDFAAALSHLDQNGHKLVDRLAVRETRARLLSSVGRHDLAAEELRKLLAVNPDNHIYIRALQACAIRSLDPHVGHNGIAGPSPDHISPPSTTASSQHHMIFAMRKLSELQRRTLGPVPSIHTVEHVSCALKVCDELSREHPYSRSSLRIALDILPSADHPQFLPRVDSYVRPFLRKGVPSLFSDIKPLYMDSSKAEALGNLFVSYRQSLENADHSALPPPLTMPEEEASANHSSAAEQNGFEEPPCTLLWVLHFLAQHYDRLGQRDSALATISEAIEHTPTTIECYLVKARILKHCGDLKGAVDVADEARNLDLADRYLNTKCSKYGLRADMVSESEAWISLFTRDGDSGGVQALYDMQCMWFELEAAESHLRRSQLPQALKKFTAVERHFADIVEDQFDFHSYCLRKVTLRAYVTLLRFEDRIRSHPYFARSANGLIRCLLRLYDMSGKQRLIAAGEHSDIKGYADMTDSERRKAVRKRRKQLARRKQGSQNVGSGKASTKATPNGIDKSHSSDSKSQNSGSGNDGKSKGGPGWMESDPDGIEYLKELFQPDKQGDKILREATRVLREMHRHLGDRVETQVLSFEVAIRSKKYLQALRAVNRAHKMDPDNPDSLFISVKLACELSKDAVTASFSDVVRKVYETKGNILNDMNIKEYISAYMHRNESYGERQIGGAKVVLWLAMNNEEDCENVEDACESMISAIERSSGDGVGYNVLSASFCRELLIHLKTVELNPDLISRITVKCKQKHPRASFM